MGIVGLDIYRTVDGTETLVAKVNKWKFQDTVMGEQFITCTVTSEVPIDWSVGDHCEFRGETYTLNYNPSVTQKAPSNSVQDAYTYENVKFDSQQDELTRCMMLDITPTTGDYVAALGTNHTGSSRFQLYCGETTANGSTLTPVCALAAKMQANLDRLYPTNGWRIYVDLQTTYTTASGETLLVTHTDSKLLTFDNSTVAQALALVHTEFKLDYCIRGRNIYIGYSIDSIDPENPIIDLTSDTIEDRFVFGYGRGYPDAVNQGKGLFQIKQIANSQQKIVTRLRALGSTKNLPYNYYFKKYGLLSQALFPNNLQLPGTFLPLGQPTDTANTDGTTKWAQNNARSPYLRKVLGDTNDSYIDKNDNAAACPEGIREDCARWDGSNGDLPEIYPTIEGVTFGELRDAGVPDQTGATGDGAYQEGETKPNGDPVQPDHERIDCLLAVGYTDNGVLIDDANIGDGIMPENEVVDTGTHFAIGLGQTKLTYNAQSEKGDFDYSDLFLEGAEQTLFTVKDVSPGEYFMVPTGPSYSCVAYRFSVNAQGNASADVGFVVRVKQKVGDTYTNIATWYSDFVTAGTSTGEKEMYLPELPDQGTTKQVERIMVTELSDVVVTFAPLIENITASGQITLTYQVGRSQSGEYDPEYTWASVQGDVASKYPFHVFIKDMGFDLTTTFNGETPVMAMKSGACVGREFEIGKNVQRATVNGIRGYLLTLNRVEDSNLHTYYPNQYYQLAAGDYFVLLNINMPDAYIRAAELRLLVAATEYLADNCETKYTYQPFIDDIYLQRNIDAMEIAGTKEKSIFWRLYAGLKLPFNGIPSSYDAPLPSVNMTIEQVSITMGDGLTPKVELTLNEDVEQTTLQKLTVAVDRIYNGSIFSSGGVGTNLEAVADICGKLFLSKVHDDIANGRITFNDAVTFLGLAKAKGGISIGDFLPGFLGSGAHIGGDGRAEFESVNVRGAIRAAELVFNQIRAEGGEKIESIGYGEILTVDEENMTATLKLDGDEWATIDEGDICRGLYNTIGKDYDNADADGEDENGFRLKAGFFASYFKIEEVLTNSKGECTFRYSLQPGTTEHPCPLMKFAVYGNSNPTKKERQSSIYTTAVGIAPRMLYLAGVDDWKIKPQNIKVAIGNIEGVLVYELLNGAASLKELHGDAGIFVEDNIYLGGIINQFTAADWQAIQDRLGQGIHAQLLRSSDNIVVDALGNIVGGIYEVFTDGATVNKRYKLHTGIMVYDSGKGMYLTAKDGTEGSLSENEYFIYASCNGCDVLRDGADFYITNIHNTYNGYSGSALSDDQLAIMRDTDECSINFVIVTANGWKTMMTYTVRLVHLDKSYIAFDLDNEMDSMSFRTQTRTYNGLPIETKINAIVDGIVMGDAAFVSATVESNAFTGSITSDNILEGVAYFGDSPSLYGLKCGIRKNGLFRIEPYGRRHNDVPDDKYWFDISCVVKYAGVNYTSPKKRFIVNEATNATLYKLLLSANAISKDGDTYTPDTIDVKVQVIDSSESIIYTESQLEALGDIKVWYLKGAYDPTWSSATLISNKVDTLPSFRDPQVTNCITVLAVDVTEPTAPVILDIESVTINSVGRDGAGQPWVKVTPQQVVIDCDSTGAVLATTLITFNASLFWGDEQCELDTTACAMGFDDEQSDTPSYSPSERPVIATRSYTFNQGDVITSKSLSISIVGFDGNGDPHSAGTNVYVTANRRGPQGVQGSSGASTRYRGVWQADAFYVWDDTFRDCVKIGSTYYLVNVPADGTELLGNPETSSDWKDIGGYNAIATELLLAENGTINLLSSNVINLFNGSGVKTASINADGNGSYCIYYPSGNKMMEFSHEGFIYYYNDNSEHTLSWKLGHGGDITKSESDDWQPIHLAHIAVDEVPTSSSVYSRVEYFKFISGSGGEFAAQDGLIYGSIPRNRNPLSPDPPMSPISDGYYTPNMAPFHKVDEDGVNTKYSITVYRIQNGKINYSQSFVRTNNGDGTHTDEPL